MQETLKLTVCSAACSVLSRIDDDLLAEVRKKGNYLRERFSGAPGIREVTGLGLMLGLVTERPAGEVVADCMAEGILCLTAKNKVRLLPALNIPWEQLREAIAVLKDLCAQIKKKKKT